MPPVYRKVFTEETEQELLLMSREAACLNLTDRQRTFCEQYVRNNNNKIAAMRAGYSKQSAHMMGWKLRQNEDVCRYLAWLKVRIAKNCHVSAMEILDHYIRIAFADITDFVEIKGRSVKLREGVEIDGQLITEIKEGRDGISIKMADKMAALAKLELFFEVMPKDWKQKIEERKVEIMQQKLELERLKLNGGEEIEGDDGFLEALKESAIEVWEDEDISGE